MKKRLVLAFSGGLDTTFCALHLKEQGWEVVTATVNTGGFDSAELARIESIARKLGAVEHHTIDARAGLFERYLRYLLYGNVLRGALYPLSVAAERVCQAAEVVRLAQRLGASAVAHGSTGAGNDQVRFDVALQVLAPELEIVTPIRDLGLTRADELAVLEAHGVAVAEDVSAYSVNRGMWGTSVGGRETLSSWDALPENAYPGGTVGDRTPHTLVLGFERGVPTRLNAAVSDPVALIESLERLATTYGIGRGVHLGETIVGIKGRVGFQAGAAYILIQAHRELEKLVLSGAQQQWKDTLGNLYGAMLHEGRYFDPLCRDLEAFLASSQASVTGDVRLTLYPRALAVDGVRSPYSMLDASVASYGESNALWNGAEARAFAKLYGVSQRLAAGARRNGSGA